MEKLFEYIQEELAFARYFNSDSIQKNKEERKASFERAFGAIILYMHLYPEEFNAVVQIWVNDYMPLFKQVIDEE